LQENIVDNSSASDTLDTIIEDAVTC